jgi:hypothetical protein
MQNIDLDEAIKEVFEVKAFRAYVYFYYFENDGVQGEIINEAFKLSKKYALLHIENMLPPERKSQAEQALDVLRRKEFDSFIKDFDSYKSDADFMIKMAKCAVL